jgi:hypothetical protein
LPSEYWIRAYDETGLVWHREASAPRNGARVDLAPQVKVDGCGDTFVIGNWFMERIDASGRLVWSRDPNFYQHEQIHDLAIGPDGNVIVTAFQPAIDVLEGAPSWIGVFAR